MFINGLRDWVQSQVVSYQKLKKIVLDTALLNIQHYVRINVKVVQCRKGVTPWCSSYWKRSLQVPLDYAHQLYFFTYIYILDIDENNQLVSWKVLKTKGNLDISKFWIISCIKACIINIHFYLVQYIFSILISVYTWVMNFE